MKQPLNKVKYQGNCWPTREQGLLLQATVWQGQKAIEAWEKWECSVDIDKLDPGSHRLLPQLYRNLRAQGVEHPLMGTFKGIYRQTWFKNQLLFNNMAALLSAFRKVGIKTLILKGAALLLLYYKEYGLRPMEDVDVLVTTEDTPAAFNLLKELGWTPIPKQLITDRHAVAFEDGAGHEFDLHSHVLSECCQEDADDDFWDGAVSIKFHNLSTYALNPTDQLLHVCVHGAKWNFTPPFRWAADAMMIMNSSNEIDWERLVTQAEKGHLILPLRDTLKYLKDILDAPVPLTTIQSMQNMPTSRSEHVRYRYKTRPTKLKGPLLIFQFYYVDHSLGEGTGLLKILIGFLRFLKDRWGVDHLWQVPFHGVMKSMSVRRIWKTAVWNSNRLLRRVSSQR
ncbi:MAG: nucleotidyltransferase family protein [Ignavibacteria bacterium]|nr:nucleotidyltransferase family protein [Ignavibacteria bacterium]